ncbi:MAG: tRNA lysidine(34) synthetase TilS [Georgfuchsia sp.]
MANSKSKPSTDLPALLKGRLVRYVEPGQGLCVALSGGIDSVVLLHAAIASAKELGFQQPVACHVNHDLSPHAGEWEGFCKKLCERLDIPLEVRRVQVTLDGDGLEAAARRARYGALNSLVYDWILLGHHRDDQAETVLLNLLRGAGVHGTAGMAEKRGRLLRPLLDISRKDIVDYAKLNGLSWIEDESNADTHYSRNFLRYKVMPLLKQPFPNAAISLTRAARAFGEAARLLDQMAEDDLGAAKILNVSRLNALSQLRAANLLTYYLRRQGLQIPGRAMVREMLRQLLAASRDSDICFRLGDYEVRRFRDQVLVDIPLEPVLPTTWSGERTVAWGRYQIQARSIVGSGISADIMGLCPLHFALRRGGDVLQLRQDGPRRHLKDLLREAGVPPWRRKNLPVLYSGDEVVWVAGIGIAAQYRCKPGAEGYLIEFDGVTW